MYLTLKNVNMPINLMLSILKKLYLFLLKKNYL